MGSQEAANNFRKHKVSFDEAVTVFYDPLSATFNDPEHSIGEERNITVGYSSTRRLLVVSYSERNDGIRIISARRANTKEKRRMKRKKTLKPDELRAEYDFDYSKAVRGKYFQRLMKEGSNVVVLEPDVAKEFRGSAAVNDALRSLLQVSKATLRLTSRSTPASRKRAVG